MSANLRYKHRGHFNTISYGETSRSSFGFLIVCSKDVLCPDTGTVMKLSGTAKRIVREPDHTFYIWIPVYYSEQTGRYHRGLPDFLRPYKHYTLNTIMASLENHTDLDLHDLPSDSSRYRWLHDSGLSLLHITYSEQYGRVRLWPFDSRRL